MLVPVITDMDQRWTEISGALESGEPDQVNRAIDEIKGMDIKKRIELFWVCFTELTNSYIAAGDGYVRQSVVRVTDQLVPGMVAIAALENEDKTLGASESDIREQTDEICGFLLEAVTDDDGRVRQSAKRALKDVFRTYDSLGDEETLEALAQELGRMAERHTGKQRKHLLEAKEDVEFTLQSPLGRLVDQLSAEFAESRQAGE